MVKWAKSGLKGLLRILIMGMNGTWMGEVVRGCIFSLFSACKVWEAGESTRAKLQCTEKAEGKQEQGEKQRQRHGRETRGSQFVSLWSKLVEITEVLLLSALLVPHPWLPE